MTVIKQTAVTSSAHASSLTRYINDDRALARDSQHIVDESRWASEMAETRAVYGHDSPSRPGAKNTIAYHQILAFLPEECSMNGGKMTAEDCMSYARAWVQERYGNHEAVWVLHKEHCSNDSTDRYAVHICLNRTDLETGKRLNEGPSKIAKIDRANAVRELDRRYGLRQLKANERNSRIHARQPTKAERTMARKGVVSDKEYIRKAVRSAVREVRESPQSNGVQAFARSLDKKGVSLSVSKSGKDFTFERRKSGLRVNGTKLGRGFSPKAIVRALGMEVAREMVRAMEEDMDR